MSYPSNRNPRDREHAYFEDDDRERGVEASGRNHMTERGHSRSQRPGERDPRESERFGERRYSDPYSGRSIGDHDEYRKREYSSRQQGYAPYPYGEDPAHRNLEDWQQPWQLGDSRADIYRPDYARESYASRHLHEQSAQRPYESRGPASRGAQTFGPYRGRGPKGYQRSDERLREDVCERLMDDPDIDASEISVEVSNGEVTLAGSVCDRAMKRAAEDVAEQASGVKQVHNTLRIETRHDRSAEHDDGYGAASTRTSIRH